MSALRLTDMEVMTPVAIRPLPTPKFLGEALDMSAEEWLQINAIHLRERWRHLLDSCEVLGIEPYEETDYLQWCLDHYETQCGCESYWRGL